MSDRATQSVEIARDGGAMGLRYFRELANLEVVDKGVQDFVTEADQNVELHIRKLIEDAFPEDGIVGEEHAPKIGTSGYRWVIDPIDGTSNFVNSMPVWCVVLAVVKDDTTEIGVIHDPNNDETFHAIKGAGATLNGAPLSTPSDTAINRGAISTGYCNRVSKSRTVAVIADILSRDGVFHRNGSGALSLAYVAAGRLIGYVEEHMNAWDCIAGQLIISEAGGKVEDQSADDMIKNGGRVVAASAGIFNELVAIADAAYDT